MVDPQKSAHFEARWRDRFQRFAQARDDDAGIAGWSPSGLDTRLRSFQRSWEGVPQGQVWLDAGCGAGTYSRQLASDGLIVCGLDYSFPTLKKARERSRVVSSWVVADVTKLPLAPNTFDGAICFGVMQALESPDRAISELAGIVRPGGEVWVDALNALCLPTLIRTAWQRVRRRPMHLRYDRPARLVDAMVGCGFARTQVIWVPIMPNRLRGLQSWVETRTVRWLFKKLPGLGLLASHAFVVRGIRSAPQSFLERR